MIFRKREEGVSLNSKCPCCGHRGCTLSFVPPSEIPTGDDKGTMRREDARVARTCDTCQAVCYQPCVLPPEKWIAK